MVTFILRISIVFDRKSFYIISTQLLSKIVRNGVLVYFRDAIRITSESGKNLIAFSVA